MVFEYDANLCKKYFNVNSSKVMKWCLLCGKQRVHQACFSPQFNVQCQCAKTGNMLVNLSKFTEKKKWSSACTELKGELNPSALYLSEVSLGPQKQLHAIHNLYICPGKVISCIYQPRVVNYGGRHFRLSRVFCYCRKYVTVVL